MSGYLLLGAWTDHPSTQWVREERVQYDGYADQDVTDVARRLSDAALLFANVLSRLHVHRLRTVAGSLPQIASWMGQKDS